MLYLWLYNLFLMFFLHTILYYLSSEQQLYLELIHYLLYYLHVHYCFKSAPKIITFLAYSYLSGSEFFVSFIAPNKQSFIVKSY